MENHSEMENDDESGSPYSAEVILAVNTDSKRFGACCIDLSNRRLVVIQDMLIDLNDNQIIHVETTIDHLFRSLEPTRVLVASKCDERFSGIIELHASSKRITLDTQRSKEFSPNQAKKTVHSINNEPSEIYTVLSELASSKSLELSLGCFGAIFSKLQTCTILEDTENSLPELIVTSEILTLNDLLYVDEETLDALHIFKPANQSSIFEKKNKNSPKCCIFDILNSTSSTLGSNKLYAWFNSPITDARKLNKRLETVNLLIDPSNSQNLDELIHAEKHLGNINYVTSSLRSGKPKCATWRKLETFLKNAVCIFNIISNLYASNSRVEIFSSIICTVNIDSIKMMINLINEIIDFNISEDWNKVYVRDGLNVQLDEYRKRYNELEEVLHQVASSIADSHSNLISKETLNVVYIPQIGYLISLEVSAEVPISETLWEEVFRTTTNIYYKDEITSSMDDKYGDIYQIIVDIEIDILYQLQTQILTEEAALIKVGELFAELDCYLSFACSTLAYGLVKPQICQSSTVQIKGGFHPLYKSFTGSFIPNDTSLEGGNPLVVTGANGSGKSVYLNQVGVIVYLAHIGSFVPAEAAEIGITDKILSRLTTRESLEKCESTFLIDLQKISKCMRIRTEKSLLLIDEFGKGTDIIGGASLLGALIQDLCRNKLQSRAILTTHFHELFHKDILHGVERLKHCHMDIILNYSCNKFSKTITYLFTLKQGLSATSFGVECAAACGIPSNIIDRAREIFSDLQLSDENSVNETKSKMSESIIEPINYDKYKKIVTQFLMWDVDRIDSNSDHWRKKLSFLFEKGNES